MDLTRPSLAGAAAFGAFLFLACGSGGDAGSSPDASAHVCTPGQSVACVGVGGCQGGQVCTADGSGYGACTCGTGGDGGSSDSSAVDATSDGSADSGDAGGGCMAYTSSTIAAMRQGASGCFRLANVVSIGATPGTASSNIHVQDATGGSFSAMRASCSSTSTTHRCTLAGSVSATPDGHSVTVTGTYVRSASTHAEQFYIDSLTDNGATATVPALSTVTLAQIQRSSTSYDLAFQKVQLTISGVDPLAMYDWTPAELAVTGASMCPYQLGFGMAATSAGLTPTAACTTGTSQPTGQVSPSPAEVLIGTDFYTGFTLSSDCRCAKNAGDQEPGVLSHLSGQVRGLLVWDVAFGSATGFMYLAPTTVSDAPITNTVTGM